MQRCWCTLYVPTGQGSHDGCWPLVPSFIDRYNPGLQVHIATLVSPITLRINQIEALLPSASYVAAVSTTKSIGKCFKPHPSVELPIGHAVHSPSPVVISLNESTSHTQLFKDDLVMKKTKV